MTIETRYALTDICGHPVLVCESREDALALAEATICTSDDNYEKFVQEVLYLPDYGADDDDNDDDGMPPIVHVLVNALKNKADASTEGGEADD